MANSNARMESSDVRTPRQEAGQLDEEKRALWRTQCVAWLESFPEGDRPHYLIGKRQYTEGQLVEEVRTETDVGKELLTGFIEDALGGKKGAEEQLQEIVCRPYDHRGTWNWEGSSARNILNALERDEPLGVRFLAAVSINPAILEGQKRGIRALLGGVIDRFRRVIAAITEPVQIPEEIRKKWRPRCLQSLRKAVQTGQERWRWPYRGRRYTAQELIQGLEGEIDDNDVIAAAEAYLGKFIANRIYQETFRP